MEKQSKKLKTMEELEYTLGNNKNLMVLVIHIEYLNSVNGEYGFSFTRRLIKYTKDKIVKHFLNYKVYKLYGGNFAVLSIYNKENYYKTINLVKSFQAMLKKDSTDIDKIELSVNTTIGIAFSSHPLQDALRARKMATKQNKDYVVAKKENIYLPDTEEYDRNIFIIEHALENNKISLYSQPIQCIESGNIVKYECLPRIDNIGTKVISPLDLLPIAKENRLYKDLAKAIITKFIEKCIKNNDTNFTINLDVPSMFCEETMDFFTRELSTNNISNMVTVELSEAFSIAKHDISRLIEYRQELKFLGAKFVIDNFGVETSSFDMLRLLSPDLIKIDGSLISNLSNSRTYEIVKSIVTIAKSLNIATIANYVNSKKIYDLCINLEIDFAQGFYIGKPEKEFLI
ncbi:MAG: GGDEF domain-containing protein [Candidatus Aerophobetes bacterium]|nr:GGDEF domain-containing protein [Candidatus Aerophobetes bacterium]